MIRIDINHKHEQVKVMIINCNCTRAVHVTKVYFYKGKKVYYTT